MTNKHNKAKHNKRQQASGDAAQLANDTKPDIVPESNNNNNAEQKPVASGSTAGTSITLAGYCAVCWREAEYYCTKCKLVGYCCMSHMATHAAKHDALCNVISRKHVEKEGRLYGSAIATADDWRYARVETVAHIATLLRRNVEPYERDLLLFPKHCASCHETRSAELVPCKLCRQVWHCRGSPGHLVGNHAAWCAKLQLFATLVRRQAAGNLYMFDMNFGPAKPKPLQFTTNDNIGKVIRIVLSDCVDLDEGKRAMISQAASGPLTVLYALRLANYAMKKKMVIHLIGAELHYEGSTLQAWETFFMDFLPEISHLKVVMVGPELKATTASETLRLCDDCRAANRSVLIQYKDGLLYHEYVNTKNYTKPDIVCAFNPGLHRSTGFNQNDTWPQTIQAAVSSNRPFVFTAYTAYEAPLDLKRVQEVCNVHIVQEPKHNPFASLKPDRNFISDHEAPLIFKNYYMSIVTAAQ